MHAMRFITPWLQPNRFTYDDLAAVKTTPCHRYVSTKKIAPHGEREWLVPATKRRKFRKTMKERIEQEKLRVAEEARKQQKHQNKRQKNGNVQPTGNGKKKKERRSQQGPDQEIVERAVAGADGGRQNDEMENHKKDKSAKKKGKNTPKGEKKAKKKKKVMNGVSQSRLAAYGL